MALVAAALVLAGPDFATAGSASGSEDISGPALRQLIEEDWLRTPVGAVSTCTDAAGACDGVKDGKYGFHTGLQPNPWWQVDLGQVQDMARIVVYNRLDYKPGLHNADRLHILTSDDGRHWTLCHDQQGHHFGGLHGAPPLDVSFGSKKVRARFVRLLVPSTRPIFFHLDEVEVYGPGAQAINLALSRPADQSSISQWSTAKATGRKTYPTAACLESGRRLVVHLGQAGVHVAPFVWQLNDAARRLEHLSAAAPEQAQRELYLQVRWIVRRLALNNPLLNFDRLLFAKRFTQETYPDVCLNHMPWVSKPGGDLCILHFPGRKEGGVASLADPERLAAGALSAQVQPILRGSLGPGHVHGMDLCWDAGRVVFGYAKARSDQPPQGWLDRSQSYRLRRTEEPIHIFEIGIDGNSLRQLSWGEWSDLDPTYLPNGDIAFVSERCRTSLQCNEYDKDETSCNLYVMRPDGSGIRRLSVSKDGDYLPHCLDNGMIGYTRWEYHERSWAFIQSLWVVRPDGTCADALFKQHFVNPWALEDVRSIPGSSKLVAIATGHHTLAVGPLVVINPAVGINDPKGIRIVTPNIKPPEGGMDGVPVAEGGVQDSGGYYSTPWALSEQFFLVAYSPSHKTTEPAGYGLYLVDVFGNRELLYRDPAISCFIPMPLRPRPRPPILPDRTDLKASHAVCSVKNVAHGCEGIAPEKIGYIRIAEPIGWPYDNVSGGQRYGEDHRYGGPGADLKNLLNWTPIRILGDVPVAADGSTTFRVPADTAVYFQLLDKERRELRRMRSFISFQPGEVRGCVGCHETRAVAPAQQDRLGTQDWLHEWPVPLPAPWGEQPVSFLRDIQPVLDRQCVRCHSGLKPAAGLDFHGGLTSHDTQVPGYGYNRAFETIISKDLVSRSAARAQDASITPPLAYGSHRSKLLTALVRPPHDREVRLSEDDRLRLTLWIDANAPYHDRFVNKRPEKPVYDLPADQILTRNLAALHHRRCVGCHQPAEVTRLDWIDLQRPERSLFLLAPLARTSGGTGKCSGTVYRGQMDADYQEALKRTQEAVERAWSNPRRDLVSLPRAAR
jgi:hypothetical protein